jgi:hypothetical protein
VSSSSAPSKKRRPLAIGTDRRPQNAGALDGTLEHLKVTQVVLLLGDLQRRPGEPGELKDLEEGKNADSNQRNQAIGALMFAYGYIKTDWRQAAGTPCPASRWSTRTRCRASSR